MEKRILGGHRSSDHFEHLVKVTVLDICGDKVRLGFEAGDGFAVHRWEVWERTGAGGRPEAG